MGDRDYELQKINNYTYGATGANMFLPYFGRFPDGFQLQPGDEVVVKGRSLPDTDGFSVNLTMPPVSSEYNCALHFNPRFREKKVIRDVRPNGHWVGKESYGGFPFKYNQEFTIVIKVMGQGYKIFVDDFHFCDFTHRVHPAEVQHICIRGNVSIISLHVRFESYAKRYKSEKMDEMEKLHRSTSEQLDSSDLKWTSLTGQTVTQAQETAYVKHTTKH